MLHIAKYFCPLIIFVFDDWERGPSLPFDLSDIIEPSVPPRQVSMGVLPPGSVHARPTAQPRSGDSKHFSFSEKNLKN